MERVYLLLDAELPSIIDIWEAIKGFENVTDVRCLFGGKWRIAAVLDGPDLASIGRTVFRNIAKLPGIITFDAVPCSSFMPHFNSAGSRYVSFLFVKHSEDARAALEHELDGAIADYAEARYEEADHIIVVAGNNGAEVLSAENKVAASGIKIIARGPCP